MHWRTFLRYFLLVVEASVFSLRLGLLVYAANIVYVLTYNSPCSDEEALKTIHKLCLDTLKKKAFGNLCIPLCESLDLQYNFCTNCGGEKDVFFMSMDMYNLTTSPVQLVMKKTRFTEDRVNNLYPTKRDDLEKVFLTDLKTLVNMHTKSEYIDNVEDLLHLFWTIEEDAQLHHKNIDFLRNVIGLASQSEYMFMLLHPIGGIVPSLHGSCGQFYFMEHVPLRLSDVAITWSSTVSIAIKLLDLLQQLEDAYFERLHICDIKADNLGLDDNNHLKLLDLDSLHFHSSLVRKMSDQHCLWDMDCELLKCRGLCNKTSQKCRPLRFNSNLQSVCENIFLGMDSYDGLLSNPPSSIDEELTKVLHSCASSNVDQHFASQEMKIRDLLRDILEKSVSSLS